MTNEIKELLDIFSKEDIFENHPLYFVGGTALSSYLDHRISYDIDIASTTKLPINDIKRLMYKIGAKFIPDKEASGFKINHGEDIENYHMRFMINGVKIEFYYRGNDLSSDILEQAKTSSYQENGTLKILALDDIIKLKTFALFNRQKARDLFDITILLSMQLITIDELDRAYSFMPYQNKILKEYIEDFSDRDEDDSSLDFLSHQEYYPIFEKLSQSKRFDKVKDIFFEQYDAAYQQKLNEKQNIAKANIKKQR